MRPWDKGAKKNIIYIINVTPVDVADGFVVNCALISIASKPLVDPDNTKIILNVWSGTVLVLVSSDLSCWSYVGDSNNNSMGNNIVLTVVDRDIIANYIDRLLPG